MSDIFKFERPAETPGGAFEACQSIVHATDLRDFFASNSLTGHGQEDMNEAEKPPLNRGINFSSRYSCYDDDG